MSIKFPDFQVLVSRSDQVPKINREGDQTGAAGKVAPQITDEFVSRQQRVDGNKAQDRVRERKDDEQRREGQNQDQADEQRKRRKGGRRRIDLRA